jgi:hypothetical protein
MDFFVLIGFALLVGICAIPYPGTVAGILLGAHSYLSSVGYLTGAPWSAVSFLGAFSGLVILTFARYRKSPEIFVKTQKLLTPIAFLCCVFAIGAVQEYSRAYASILSIEDANGISAQLSMLTVRDELNATLIVITRWIPYTFVAVLGCILGGPSRFMNGFSLTVVLQMTAIPWGFYAEYFGQLLSAEAPAGLEWGAINRAYMGYECGIAASWFLLMALARSSFNDNWHLYLFGFLGLSLVFLSFSKGPWLAAVISTAVIFVTKSKSDFSHVGKTVGVSVVAVVLIGVGFVIFQRYGMDNKFAEHIGDDFRINQSLSIRWELLSKAAFPSANDVKSWLFGGGFGWSRWQIGATAGLPVFVGAGTHIFFLDVFLDVGVVGLILVAASISRLYFIAFSNFAARNSQKRLIARFTAIFCVTLAIKMLFASDSYSEPLMAVFIGLLIGCALSNRGQAQIGRSISYHDSKELK